MFSFAAYKQFQWHFKFQRYRLVKYNKIRHATPTGFKTTTPIAPVTVTVVKYHFVGPIATHESYHRQCSQGQWRGPNRKIHEVME